MTTFIPRVLGVLALFAIATTGCQPGGATSGIDGTVCADRSSQRPTVA
jgi:hypothetical protein